MRALLYTEDPGDVNGVHIPFFFNEQDVKGYYEPTEVEGIKYFNILINGSFLTIVQGKHIKKYLEDRFKDD